MHEKSRWTIHQGNNYNPTLDLHLVGDKLTGIAHLTSEEGVRAGYAGAVSQPFEGHVHGDRVKIKIVWPAKRDGSHSIGVYEGRVCDDKIEGRCHDELNPGYGTYDWYATPL